MKSLKLGDVVDLFNGSTPLKSNKDYWANGDVPWFTVDDLRNQGKYITHTEKFITQLGLKDTSISLIPENAILLCCTASVGAIAVSKIPLTTNQQFNALVVRDANQLLVEYLYYWFLANMDTLKSLGRATTIEYVSMSKLRDMALRLPPVEKQREIIEKLDNAFAEIEIVEKNLVLSEAKADELLYSLLNESFSYPAVSAEPTITSPKQSINAKFVELKGVVSIEKKQGSFDLAYVGLEDIESNTGTHLGSLEPRKVKSNTFAFTSEHLLYGRLRPYLNKVLLPSFDGHCSTEIFPIKVSKDLLREYLFYWFRLQSTIEAINETSTGARMPRANMDAVLEFEIPLPPVAEQREIIHRLNSVFVEIEAFKTQINKQKDYAIALRQSVLGSAFAQEEAVA